MIELVSESRCIQRDRCVDAFATDVFDALLGRAVHSEDLAQCLHEFRQLNPRHLSSGR